MRLVSPAARENNTAMRGVGFRVVVFLIVFLFGRGPVFATTKGLSEIITPDLQPEGDLSLSFQAQNKLIGNPDQLQTELGLSRWAEVKEWAGE